MTDYKDRMKEEHAELSHRIAKLDAFINTNPTFKDLAIEEQADLKEQLRIMLEYEKVLWRRYQRVC